MNRFLKITAVLLAVLTMVACGGGGESSAPQGRGNTQFNLHNTSRADITRVTVTSITTKQPTSDQAFNCPVENDCGFLADTDGPVNLSFYRANGDLVAAYYNYEPANGLVLVHTSRFMLGAYLFEQIDNQVPELTSVVAARLSNYFVNNSSPDGTPDFYQELGQYYRTLVVQGGMSPAAFYEKVIADLASGVQLPAASIVYAMNHLIYRPVLEFADRHFSINNAVAGSAICPLMSDVLTGSGGISQALGEWKNLMPAKVVSPLLGAFGSIWGSTCDTSTEITDMLSALTNKLNEMQKQLDTIQTEMSSFFGYLAQHNADMTELTLVDTNIATLSGAASQYHNVMYGADTKKKYKNLRDYIDQNGGLESALNGNFMNRYTGNQYLADLYCSGKSYCLDNQIEAVKTLSNSLLTKDFAASLSKSCKPQSSGDDRDFLQIRTACNVQILRVSTRLASALQQALLVLKDEYETLNYYAENGNASTKVFLEKSGYKKDGTWIGTYQVAQANITSAMRNIEALKVGETNGLFDPIIELRNSHQPLLDSIADVCGAPGSGAPNVTGLYPNHNKKFLVATCAGGFSSRYFYENDSQNVALVMGVLVPQDKLSYYGSGSATHSTIGAGCGDSAYGSYKKHGVAFDISDSPSMVGYFDVNIGERATFPNLYMSNMQSTSSVKLDQVSPISLYHKEEGTDWAYSWVRYTDTDKLRSADGGKAATISYAFKMGLQNNSGASVDWICVTANCKRDSPISTMKFDDGPKIMIGSKDTHPSCDSKALGDRKYFKPIIEN